MDNRRDFFNGCLPGNWTEADVNTTKKEEKREERQRKDLATLLAELEEIKNGFEKIQEKQIRLQNLMKFYRGELAAE